MCVGRPLEIEKHGNGLDPDSDFDPGGINYRSPREKVPKAFLKFKVTPNSTKLREKRSEI